MDGLILSLEIESLYFSGDVENCENWILKVKRVFFEEVLCVSQQFFVQSFGVYVDEKFNLNLSFGKSGDKSDESFYVVFEKLKFIKKNLCFCVKNDL